MLILILNSFADNNLRIGIEAGYLSNSTRINNNSSIYNDNWRKSTDFKFPVGHGYFLGGNIILRVNDFFDIESGLLYRYHESNVNTSSKTNSAFVNLKMERSALAIPLLVVHRIKSNKFNTLFNLGIQYNYVFEDKFSAKNNYSTIYQNTHSYYSKTYYQIGLGVEKSLPKNLNISFMLNFISDFYLKSDVKQDLGGYWGIDLLPLQSAFFTPSLKILWTI